MKTKKNNKKVFDFFVLNTIEPYGVDPELTDHYIVFATSTKSARKLAQQHSRSDIWKDCKKTICRTLKNCYRSNTRSHVIMSQNRAYQSEP